MWMSGLVHPEDMAQPPPSSLFHFFYDVVDASPFAHFSIGNMLFPVDLEDAAKTPAFEAFESAFNNNIIHY